MRAITWISALLLCAFLLAACGGGDERSNGAANGGGVAASCGAIADIQSYRYTVTLKLQSPAPVTTAPAAGSATPGAPLSAFADALTKLFSDFTLEGAYIAPDRTQAILRFQDEDLELRAVGDKSWLRVGATWQEEKQTEEGVLTPALVCNDIVTEIASSLNSSQAKPETVNGIQTEHYRLDQTTLKQLPQALGAQLPDKYAVDLWLARDGRWPAQVHIESSDVNEKGQPIGFLLDMNIRDVNDQGIRIEPPVIAQAAP